MYTSDEIDVLVAYVGPENAWYVIPIEGIPECEGSKAFSSAAEASVET